MTPTNKPATENMNHTPTPWEMHFSFSENEMRPGIKAGGVFLADIVGSDTTAEEDQANAEFIVRAVNSHDALVEALKGFVAACESAPPVDLMRHIANACNGAKAALKLAEGKE